jgi:hypothetical protein
MHMCFMEGCWGARAPDGAVCLLVDVGIERAHGYGLILVFPYAGSPYAACATTGHLPAESLRRYAIACAYLHPQCAHTFSALFTLSGTS